MATLSRPIKLSFAELSSMTSEEKQKRLDELVQSVLNPSPSRLVEWLAELNQKLSSYERKYGITSEEMKNRVEQGQMPETNEVCSWLMLLGKRSRFEARQSKT
jgi:hypothetical protein